jgi:hypothetical protein
MLETRYLPSGLFVRESVDERQIQRELQAIDPDLFLDKEFDSAHSVVFYCVKVHLGSASPPELVLDWRDSDDRPRQLSSGILSEVRRIMSQGPVSLDEIVRRNAEVTARKRSDVDYGYEEIARDFVKRESAAHGPVLHRGAHLRRSRDAERARGRKV